MTRALPAVFAFVVGFYLGGVFNSPLNTELNEAYKENAASAPPLLEEAVSVETNVIDEVAFKEKRPGSNSVEAIPILKPSNSHTISTTESLIKAIELASDHEISEFIHAKGILDKDVLDAISNKQSAAKRLLDIALHKEDEGSSLLVTQVSFTDEFLHEQYFLFKESFYAEDRNIYAVFETQAETTEKVLVKWMRKEDGKVLLFKNMPIDIGEETNYINISARNGWQPGAYQVSIYNTRDELKLLASGEYRVFQ